MACKEKEDPLDLRVTVDLKGLQVKEELKDPKGTEDSKEKEVLKEFKEFKEKKVKKVNKE